MMNSKYTIHSLQVGESIILKVSSRQKYSNHQLQLKEGEAYSFAVNTNGPRWWDMVIPTYGEGWDSCIVRNSWKRIPGLPIFYLCGCVDMDDDHTFAIGNLLPSWSSSSDGVLSFFANDLPYMYCNNHGNLELEIRRQQ